MTDLATLFARDPLLLTQEDILQIVTEMRAARSKFGQGNAKAGSMKPLTEAQKQRKEIASGLKITL